MMHLRLVKPAEGRGKVKCRSTKQRNRHNYYPMGREMFPDIPRNLTSWLTHRSREFLFVLIGICVIRQWIVPLNQSLWLDELTSAWVTSGTLCEVGERAVQVQGQTPFYYVLLWGEKQLFGTSEVAHRLISLLAVIGATILLYRISAHFFPKDRSLFAPLIFLAVGNVQGILISARPYSLALFLFLGATLALLHWSRSGSLLAMALYIVGVASTFYAHYLFAGIVVLHIIYLILNGKKLSIRTPHYIGCLCIVAVLCIPSLSQLLALAQNKKIIGFAPMPSLTSVLTVIFIPFFPLILSWLLLRIGAKQESSSSDTVSFSNVTWFFLWWILPPMLLAAVSWLQGTSIFLGRYITWGWPGFALLGTAVISCLPSYIRQLLAVTLFALLMYCYEIDTPKYEEDWQSAARYAAEMARQEQMAEQTPVLFYSGLIESKQLTWLADTKTSDYLRCAFSYYQFPGRPLLLPLTPEAEDSKQYWSKKVAPVLAENEEIVLIFLDQTTYAELPTAGLSLGQYFTAKLAEAGYQLRKSKEFKRVYVMKFERSTSRKAKIGEREVGDA